MLGVVKLVPVPSEEPPVSAAYQLIVPADAVASRLTVPVPQRDAGVVPVIVGIVFIVILNVLESATQGEPLGLFVVTVTVIVLPASAATGVYSIVNGFMFAVLLVKLPPALPLKAMLTDVAEPPKVLPVTVTFAVPHVDSVLFVKLTVGGFAQLQFTVNGTDAVQSVPTFLTVRL